MRIFIRVKENITLFAAFDINEKVKDPIGVLDLLEEFLFLKANMRTNTYMKSLLV